MSYQCLLSDFNYFNFLHPWFQVEDQQFPCADPSSPESDPSRHITQASHSPSNPETFDFTTPDISHITRTDHQNIYEPAEDTFLLLDALQTECQFLRERKPLICLEVGSGSGVVSTFAAQMLGNKTFYLCTDINSKAAHITKQTGSENNVNLNPLLADLASPLLDRIAGHVDLLLFNPPYVVTPSEEVGRPGTKAGIEASWAGGKDGREVIDRLLPCIPRLLSPSGVFYMVVLKENRPNEIAKMLIEQNMEASVILSRRCGAEFLAILRFVRKY